MQVTAFAAIEDLCQRVYEMQACISCAVNGLCNPQIITSLSNKMSQLESNLQELDDFVAQLPELSEINATIEEIRSIYEQSQTLQDFEDPAPQLPIKTATRLNNKSPHQANGQKQSSQRIQSNHNNQKQTTPLSQKQALAHSVKHQPIQQQSAQQQKQQPHDQLQDAEGLIQFVTQQELTQASKSVNYRIPVDKLNVYISEINEVLKRKMSIIRLQPNQVKASSRRLWERYKDEELEGDDRIFFTQEDVKETATMKINSLKVLSVLQALGRISCSTDSHVKRYFIR
ncbi:hypothetical protein TRFO_18978 [Tritrichomonas foetus]|uniref:Spindle and kinetochore-associated protein 1 n=1 Tax=Tritrichomonas foetus TaxID=1144522 RepID=A0A1J4KP10_9EUKA|nr:hypothetical protein TRFO_18978 [Tritrichomonas foetus]|eukprot:OHT11532.1 hypothetical protein TRFO_18978 [Tritrichomonas foetus]